MNTNNKGNANEITFVNNAWV